jgi:hypothetical protein
MNTIITMLSEKVDEDNKATEGPKERWNKMRLKLGELQKKKGKICVNAKRETWEEMVRPQMHRFDPTTVQLFLVGNGNKVR